MNACENSDSINRPFPRRAIELVWRPQRAIWDAVLNAIFLGFVSSLLTLANPNVTPLLRAVTGIAIAVVWLAWRWKPLRQAFRNGTVKLQANEAGLVISTARNLRRCRWDEVEAFAHESQSQDGQPGVWATIYGQDKRILGQWNREWFFGYGDVLAVCDDLARYIDARLQERGFRPQPDLQYLKRLRELHAFRGGVSITVVSGCAWLGALWAIFWIMVAIGLYVAPKGGVVQAGCFLLLGLAGVYTILISGTLQVTEEVIESKTRISQHRILWSEVRSIQADPERQHLVFFGTKKHLATFGAATWDGNHKDDMLRFIQGRAQELKIPFEVYEGAGTRFSRGTRVRT